MEVHSNKRYTSYKTQLIFLLFNRRKVHAHGPDFIFQKFFSKVF